MRHCSHPSRSGYPAAYIMKSVMSNTTIADRAPRVIFLGMQSHFSLPSLRALLDNGIDVCAVATPVSQGLGLEQVAIRLKEQPRTMHGLLPVLNSSLYTNIVQLAWERQIPVWEVQRLSDPTTVSTLAAYQPDVICVACFSQRIPRVILDLPRLGCINVHPSLLPVHRGPMPLFWTLREGSKQTGVTIHCMDEGMDTGDILAQRVIDVPDGISYTQLELQSAVQGGELLAETVWHLYNGSAVRLAQDEAQSSYDPFPTSDDLLFH